MSGLRGALTGAGVTAAFLATACAASAHGSANDHRTVGQPFHLPGTGIVQRTRGGLFAVRLPGGGTLYTHGGDPPRPPVAGDLAFTSDTTAGGGTQPPGGGDGRTTQSACDIDVSVTLSPSINYRGNPFGDNSHVADPAGSYSGSGSGTCTVADSASSSAVRSYGVSLALSGDYNGMMCTDPLDLSGTTTFTPNDGSPATGSGTELHVSSPSTSRQSSAKATFDGIESPLGITVYWSDSPCVVGGLFNIANSPGPSGLQFVGKVVVPVQAVQAPTTPDEPVNACDHTDCDTEPGPDPCELVPCDSPPDPCGTGACEPLGKSAALRPPVCASAGQYGIQMAYAHPSNRPTNYRKLVPRLRTLISRMNARLYDDARRSSGNQSAARYRVLCSGGKPTVRKFKVTNKANQNRNLYSDVAGQARSAGLNATTEKYLIFYDGASAKVKLPNGQKIQPCGQGNVPGDDSLANTNRNDSGPDYAVIYKGCFSASTSMHEVGHNMGAVQLSAPHTSGAYHCNDGLDIMCYADGGNKSHYKDTVCTDLEHFDCRHDDYFDTQPSGYLSTHWNIGWSGNRFLSFP
jgi:hypothetical protein